MKKIINRHRYLDHIRTTRKKHITFLLGPRRAGKTFLMQQLYQEHPETSLYLSFDDHAITKQFQNKESFLSYLTLHTKNKHIEYLYLDEVQLVPGISRLLKQWYDETTFTGQQRPLIVASGSGSYQIFQQMEDSLVGRSETIFIYPLSFQEYLSYHGHNLQDILDHRVPSTYTTYQHLIEEYLQFGGYPEVVLASAKEEKIAILKRILSSWHEKDIKLIMQGDDWLNFQRLFQYLATRICSITKIAQYAKDLGISTYLVKKYLLIAEKSFMLHKLPPLVHDPKKEITKGNKWYIVDTGLLNYTLGNFSILNRGDLIENFVIDQYKRIHPDRTYYRKKKNGSEIDLVHKDILSNTYDIIEIKASSTQTFPKIFSSFATHYPVRRMILLNKDISILRENNAGEKVQVLPYISSSLQEEY